MPLGFFSIKKQKIANPLYINIKNIIIYLYLYAKS